MRNLEPITGSKITYRLCNQYGGRMLQAKFSVNESQAHFLSDYKKHGFKDKSSMVRTAIDKLKRELEFEQLKQSADLYSEIYSENDDLKDLTESVINGWPK